MAVLDDFFKHSSVLPKERQHLSVRLSVLPSLHPSIYASTALCWALAAFSVSWSFYTVGRTLGLGISPSQGRYLHTGQHKHRIKALRHPCHKWDSNPRSQCLSGLNKANITLSITGHGRIYPHSKKFVLTRRYVADCLRLVTGLTWLYKFIFWDIVNVEIALM
jgi:hypothetical protein